MAGFLTKTAGWVKFSLITLEIFLLLAFFVQLKMVVDYSSAYEKIQNSLKEIQAIQQFEENVNSISSRLKYVKELRKNPDTNALVLGSLEKIIPTEITLTEVKIEKNRLTLSGTMLNINALRSLITSIRANKGLKNFVVTNVVVPSSRSPYYIFSGTVDIQTIRGVW